MTGILRQQSKIFAENAPIRLVTAFRTAGDNPTQSKTPDVIQNETYSIGWINADNTGNLIPYAEDMNGVLYTLSYNTSYLFEKGMPEYSPEQTYYENSFCQYGGYLYRCKVDETLNIAPTNTNYWDKIETDAYSATNIGTGEGFYASMSGTQFRFKTLIAADDSVVIDSGDDYVSIRSVAQVPSITASSPLSYINGALSIQAADSSQGGYLTAADWASFNGKLSSTIFSGSNDWTGVNKFSSGQFTNILALGKYSETASDRYVILQSYSTQYAGSLTNWGALGYYDSQFTFAPITSGSYSLGTSNYKWGSVYTDVMYADNIRSTTPPQDPLTYNPINLGYDGRYPIAIISEGRISPDDIYGGYILPGSTRCTLGYTSLEWLAVYTNRLIIGGNGFSSSSNTVYPDSDNTYSLGNVSHAFHTINTNRIQPNDANLRINSKAASDIYVIPGAASGHGSYLGNSSSPWTIVYTEAIKGGGSNNTITLPTSNGSNTEYNNGSAASYAGHYFKIGGGLKFYIEGTKVQTQVNFIPNGNGTLECGGSNNRWKKVYASSGGFDSSDRRLKDDIEPLENALEKLNTIAINSFTWKNDKSHIQYGLIAQDEIEKNPELIEVPDSYDESNEEIGNLSVITNNVIYLAVRAIQELSAEVEILKQQLRRIRNED